MSAQEEFVVCGAAGEYSISAAEMIKFGVHAPTMRCPLCGKTDTEMDGVLSILCEGEEKGDYCMACSERAILAHVPKMEPIEEVPK